MRQLLMVSAALLFCTAGAVQGQELRVKAVHLRPDHDLLGNPTGMGLSIGFHPHELVGVQIGFEYALDEFRTVGSTCVGLIPPEMWEGCADEPREETATFQAIALTLPVTLLSRDRVQVRVLPAYRRSWMESDRRGVESHRVLSAEKRMSGFGIGGEVLVRPFLARRLWLHAGAHASTLNQFEDELELDGYSPFEKEFPLAQFEIGISYYR
jgi:hypothetical protein